MDVPVEVVFEASGHAMLQAWPVDENEIDVLLAYAEGCFIGRGARLVEGDVLVIPVANQQDGRLVLNTLLQAMEEAAGGDRASRGPFGMVTGRQAPTLSKPNGSHGPGRVKGILPTHEPQGWCFVQKIDANSPALLAGFEVGDCILACMGRALDADDVDGLALHDALVRLPSKAKVNVVVQRKDRLIEIVFELI